METPRSIYGFMVIYPEVHRARSGSYCNAQVAIAFGLIMLNITLQVSLTYIAGSTIFDAQRAYKTALTDEEGDFVKETNRIRDDAYTIQEEYLDLPGVLGLGEEGGDGRPCCVGVECAGLAIPCCEHRRGINTAPPDRNATELTQVRKPKPKGKQESGTHSRSISLCQVDLNHKLDCTPPTYVYTDAWKDLDADGDGTWSRTEAQADENNLGCKLGVPSEKVFLSLTNGLRRYMEDISRQPVPASIEDRVAVPHADFELWAGIATICSAVNHNRCSEMIRMGVFDGALQAGNVGKKGFRNLEDALDYCQKLLVPGGICEKAMPVTYIMYRQEVADKCGKAAFAQGQVYANPYDPTDVIHLVSLRYPEVEKYTMAESLTFQFFLCLILLVWYINLLGELNAIVHMTDFCYNFPGAEGGDPLLLRLAALKARDRYDTLRRSFNSRSSNLGEGQDGSPAKDAEAQNGSPAKDVEGLDGSPATDAEVAEVAEPAKESPRWHSPRATPRSRQSPRATPRSIRGSQVGEDKVVLRDISLIHRCMCFIVLFVRAWLLIYMAQVGTVFTLSTYSYPDLLMNAVALAFVFELPEFIYALLVRYEDKMDVESAGELLFESSLPRVGRHGVWGTIFSVYFMGLVVFPIVAILTVHCHTDFHVQPIYEALNCACLQVGDRCVASERLSRRWFNEHWARLESLGKLSVGRLLQVGRP